MLTLTFRSQKINVGGRGGTKQKKAIVHLNINGKGGGGGEAKEGEKK